MRGSRWGPEAVNRRRHPSSAADVVGQASLTSSPRLTKRYEVHHRVPLSTRLEDALREGAGAGPVCGTSPEEG